MAIARADAAIFDLDGVLVDTARFHLEAWAEVSGELGFALDPEIGESLKGVGRETALGIVLRSVGLDLSAERRSEIAARKNELYNQRLTTLNEHSLLPGALDALHALGASGVPVALASASRNARTILELTNITSLFDAIVDGTVVTIAKPDPTVFLTAARQLKVDPSRAIVFEDAVAGVEGALRAGCSVVGVGDARILSGAELVVSSLSDVPWPTLFTLHDAERSDVH